jgi:hypothetical protein
LLILLLLIGLVLIALVVGPVLIEQMACSRQAPATYANSLAAASSGPLRFM